MLNSKLTRTGSTGATGAIVAIVALAFVSILGSAGPVIPKNSTRIEISGLVLPQPKEKVALVAEGSSRTPENYIIDSILIDLDKKGNVQKISWNHSPEDSLRFKPYEKSLRAVRFWPAEYHGKKIPFTLSALFIVHSSRFGAGPTLILPVEQTGVAQDIELLKASCNINGYKLSKPVSFPSYFYLPPPFQDDTALLPPTVILRISIDTLGAISGREIVYASDRNLAQMIQIACSWAEFSPANFNGESVNGSGMLVVRFFRELKYPTGPWISARGERESGLLERVRLSWFPGTALPEFFPLIRRADDYRIAFALNSGAESPKQAQIRISERARVKVKNLRGAPDPSDRSAIEKRLGELTAYPSFRLTKNTNSELVIQRFPTRGVINLIPTDSSRFQIRAEFPFHIAPRYTPR